VCVLYCVIQVPFRIGFNLNPSAVELSFDDLITAIFGVDILLTFNTAYLDSATEKHVFRRNDIAWHYLKFWFWVDLISTFPFYHIILSLDPYHMGVLRVLRILRLSRLFKLYFAAKERNVVSSLGLNAAFVNMGLLGLQIFFIAHVLACFWHFIALPSAVGTFPRNWLETFGLNTATLATRYVTSLYFVIISMLTIGFGDIHPTNELERLYAIITMLVGGIVFGALVSKVTMIIDRRNPQAKAYAAKMKEFKLLLADSGLPLSIRNRAKVNF
jgi:hypothetical protein